MKNGIYLLLPVKSSAGKPEISINQSNFTIYDIKPIDNKIHSSELQWISKKNSQYNILYLLHIKKKSSANRENVKISIKFGNGKKYWNTKERQITNIPTERIGNNYPQNHGEVHFIFDMVYKTVGNPTYIYPEEENIITLGEEVSNIKMYFEQRNEWQPPGTFYFIKDLVLYICEMYSINKQIEIDVILFIFQSTYINDCSSFLKYFENERDIRTVELPFKFKISDVNNSQKITKMFNDIIIERQFEINSDKFSQFNAEHKENIRNSIKKYFLLYLVKYNQSDLLKYVDMFNVKGNNFSTRFISILTESNYSSLFTKIGLEENNLFNLVKYCTTETEYKGLFKYINDISVFIKLIKHQNNINIIKESEKKFTKPIILIFKLNNESVNDLQQYADDCLFILSNKFTNISISGKYLQNKIHKLENPLTIMSFINKNKDVIDLMNIEIQIKSNKIKDYEGKLVLLNYMEIQEQKLKNKLTQIHINYEWIKDLLTKYVLKESILTIADLLKKIDNDYPNLTLENNDLHSLFKDKLIQEIKQGKQINENLLDLFLLDANNKNSYLKLFDNISNLITFEQVNESFSQKFIQFINLYFSNNRVSLIKHLCMFLSKCQTIDELTNFLNVISQFKISGQLFVLNCKNSFCKFLEQPENRKIEIIEQFFKLFFSAEENQKYLDDIIDKIKIHLDEQKISQVFRFLYKSKIPINLKTQISIINYLFKNSNDYMIDDSYNLIMEYKDNKTLLKLMFTKKTDHIIKEEDFVNETDKFKFFTKLVDGKVFKFEGPFEPLKKEAFFIETNNTLQKIQKIIQNREYKLFFLKKLSQMENKLTNNINYIYLHSNKKIEKILDTLTNDICTFINYEKLISTVIKFEEFFYHKTELHKLKDILKTKTIKYLLEHHEFELIKMKTQSLEAETYIEVMDSKFFNIIYKHLKEDDEKIRRETAMKNFTLLACLLNINTYKQIPINIIKDIELFCHPGEIEKEFLFLESFFKEATKIKPNEVMKKLILKSRQNTILKFVEATLLLCGEFKVKETDFILKYKEIRKQLINEFIKVEELQSIENIFQDGIFQINDHEQSYNQIIRLIHNQNNLFDLLNFVTKNTINELNQNLKIFPNNFISSFDLTKFEEVFNFWEELKDSKGKTDIIFLSEFKELTYRKNITQNFELIIQKLSHFQNLFKTINNKKVEHLEAINLIIENSIVHIFQDNNELGNIICELTVTQNRHQPISMENLLNLRKVAQFQISFNVEKEFLKNIMQFIQIIHYLEELKYIIQKLFDKGDIKTHNYILYIKKGEVTITQNLSEHINIKDFLRELRERLNNLLDVQINAYKRQEDIESTFIYGKYIFQLNNYIKTGKGIDSFESLFKYIFRNKYDRTKLENVRNNFQYQNIDDSFDVMKESINRFLKELFKEFQLNIDDLFIPSKIKKKNIITTPGIHKYILKDQCILEEEILKVYQYYTGNFPLSQTFLLCNKDTTPEEIIAFIYRALNYPQLVLFGLARLELLIPTTREKIISILEDKKKIENMQSVLVLFFTDKLLDIHILMEKVNELQAMECEFNFKHIFIYISDIPGIGKSYQIKKAINNNHHFKYEYFALGGNINKISLIKRLNKIKFESNTNTSIHLDIMNPNDIEKIKDFLFSFIILKNYYDKDEFFYYESQIIIYIELPKDYYKQLPFLSLMKIIEFKKEQLFPYDISSNLKSNEQIVGNILQHYESQRQNLFVEQPISNPLIELTPKNCNKIIDSYHDYQNSNYLQKQNFIIILASLLTEFIKNEYFKFETLNSLVSDKKYGNIRISLFKVLISYAQYLSKGNYNSLIEMQNCSDIKEKQNILNNINQIACDQINTFIPFFNQDKLTLTIIVTKNIEDLSQEDLSFLKAATFYFQITPNNLVELLKDTVDSQSIIKQFLHIFNINSFIFPQEILQTRLNHSNIETKANFIAENIVFPYIFTRDNFVKILMILTLSKANLPVILMGETGCGKTFLIKTMVKIYGGDLKELQINGETNENNIINFLEVNNLLMDNENNEQQNTLIWLLLDEFNSCNELVLISEIFLKRSVYGKQLNPNIKVIGTCNPYRIKDNSKKVDVNNISTTNKTENIHLLYDVYPLLHSLMNYVLYFGNIKEKEEEQYIINMVTVTILKVCKQYKLNEDNIQQHQKCAIEAIKFCHEHRRKYNDISSVSLRDIRRFIIIYEWYVNYLLIKIKDPDYLNIPKQTFNSYKKMIQEIQEGNYNDLLKNAIILAIYICYYLRVFNKKEKLEMKTKLTHIFSRTFTEFPKLEVLDFVKRLHVFKGIFLNGSMSKILYNVFVCINSQVPVIICGKPGCSKSLSVKIIINSMKGSNSSNYLFRQLPKVEVTAYQGSLTSTPEGVLKAFDEARSLVKKSKQLKEQIISLLFFDEMGLAEISKNNPLKVINHQLEYDENQDKISFVGISNWTMNISTMNRCLFLAIPEPKTQQLLNIAQCIVNSFRNDKFFEKYKEVIEILSKTYYLYKEHLNSLEGNNGLYTDFHGLRDFYNLIICAIKLLLNNNKKDFIFRQCIGRNLAGLPFSVQKFTEIMLTSEQLKEINKSLNINSYYEPLNCILDNINDYESRFLIIFIDSSNLEFIIESLLQKNNREYILYNGSKFIDDENSQVYNLRMLLKIEQVIKNGKVLCLSNLDYLYPSYYDVFNQNYTILNNKKFATVAIGINSNIQTYIHDKLRIVVFMNSKCLNKRETLPETPFLSRFEKHILNYDDLLQTKHIDLNKLKEIINYFNKFKKIQTKINPKVLILYPKQNKNLNQYSESEIIINNLLINCNDAEIKGIIYKLFNVQNQEFHQFINTMLEIIVKLFPQEILALLQMTEISLNANLINTIFRFYSQYTNINTSLKKYLENTESEKSIIYTYTHFIFGFKKFECESMFPGIGKRTINNNTIKQISLNIIKSEEELENLICDFYNHPEQNLCIFKLIPKDCIHLNSIKNILVNLRKEYKVDLPKPKKIIIIIYLKKFFSTIKYSDKEINEYSLDNSQLISQIVTDYSQITIDHLFSKYDDIDITKLLKLTNRELFLLKFSDKQTNQMKQFFDMNEVIRQEIVNVLEYIKYNVKGTILNIKEYRQKVKDFILLDEQLFSQIKEIICCEADKMEKFSKSVFYEKNETYTIYYTSFIEIFQTYIRRIFLELLTKLIITFESEGIFYPRIFNVSDNSELLICNKQTFNKLSANINLSKITVRFEKNANKVVLINGIKIIQSIGKFKHIKEKMKPHINKLKIIEHQRRKDNIIQQINENQYTMRIHVALKNEFGNNYIQFKDELLDDYIKFYLSLHNFKIFSIYIELLKLIIHKKFENEQEPKRIILWLEINETYIISIFYVYNLILKNKENKEIVQFLNEVKREINLIEYKGTNTLQNINIGMFELAEAFLKVLIDQTNLIENVNELKTACKMMKNVYYELALNSQYLYDFENIIETYEILKNEKFTNELIQHIKNNNEDNLELKIQNFPKNQDVSNFNKFIIKYLIAEYTKNQNDNKQVEIITKYILKEIPLVLLSKQFLYLVLKNTNNSFEPDTVNFTENPTFFTNANHPQVQIIFRLLAQAKSEPDHERKKLIIENYFLFIFENIIKYFFEQLIAKETNGLESYGKKISQEIKIIQPKNDRNDGIIFTYFEIALNHIKKYIEEKEDKKYQLTIVFLYSIAYIKIYLEYLAKYLCNHEEELGNVNPILCKFTNELGGQKHQSFKKVLIYYLLKHCHKHSGTFKNFISSVQNNESLLSQLQQIVKKDDIVNVEFSEFDFPFLFESQIKTTEEFFENLEKFTREDETIKAINYLFNNLFVYSLSYSKGQTPINNYNNEYIQNLRDRNVFKHNKILQQCLNLFLNCKKENKAQFFKDLEILTQREYLRILLCLNVVMILIIKKNSEFKDYYFEIKNNQEQKIIDSFENNVEYIVNLSILFFGKYLFCSPNNLIEISEQKRSRASLFNLLLLIQQLEARMVEPIELFFYLFYQKLISNININTASMEIQNDFKKLNERNEKVLIPNNNNYMQQFEDIVKEVYDPNYYNDLPYLKYFYLSDIRSMVKHKEFLSNLDKLSNFPLYEYILNPQKSQQLEKLKFLKSIIPFTKEIMIQYQFKIMEVDAQKQTIQSFIKKNITRQNLFIDFQNAWNKIAELEEFFSKIDKIDKTSSILYCLPRENQNQKGYQLTYIFKELSKIQNNFIDDMIQYFKNSPKKDSYKYLLDQLSLHEIDVENLTPNEIINSDQFQIKDSLNNISKLFFLYSDRDFFNPDGSINYRRYRNIIVDDEKIHEELINTILLGKKKISNKISYFHFQTKRNLNKIQNYLHHSKAVIYNQDLQK